MNARRYVAAPVVSNVCALGQGGADAPKRAHPLLRSAWLRRPDRDTVTR